MKLVSQTNAHWQYYLNQKEADILTGLLKNFPFSEAATPEISRTDDDPQTAERARLLDESLADHRKELKKLASTLLANDRWQSSGKGRLLTLNTDSRELLLQVLNDIRVGCWHSLGQPESLYKAMPEAQKAHQTLMNLAGYFESALIEHED